MSRPTGRAAWRDPCKTKQLYLLTEENFQIVRTVELDENGKPATTTHKHITDDRVGQCWAQGRLRPGDILLCDELSGDCFYNWYLVDYAKYGNHQGVHMRLVPYRIGAYATGKLLPGLTEREYHLLMAGEEVEVMVKLLNI